VSMTAFMYFIDFVNMLWQTGLIIFTIVVLQVLHLLRIRMHNPMMWDEWYTSFIHHAGFLPLARLITDGLPLMDSAVLMTLVDPHVPPSMW
jgi:hypothetical protein